MAFENVGKVWIPAYLSEDFDGCAKPAWVESTTLHHIAEPSLAQRTNGLTNPHIFNIRVYYKNPKPLMGVQAVSLNLSSLDIEILGFYDIGVEDPESGRGPSCRTNAVTATGILLDWLGFQKSKHALIFHRDEPKTDSTCPGTAVTKDWFLGLIPDTVADFLHQPAPFSKPEVGIAWDKFHFAVGSDMCPSCCAFPQKAWNRGMWLRHSRPGMPSSTAGTNSARANSLCRKTRSPSRMKQVGLPPASPWKSAT